MRKHARSEGNRKIHRRIRKVEEGARAEIGSRVFPFRTPPPASPASMPTAGTRRSTKVFVKAGGDAEPRVLRSGRQVSALKPRTGWMKILDGSNGDGSWWKNTWTEPEPEKEKQFGIVYSRKRRRSTSSTSESTDGTDRRFGIFFTRKHKRKGQKPSPLALEPVVDVVSQSLELAVVLDHSTGSCTVSLARILVPVLSFMRTARVRFHYLATFLSYGSIANTFSANGVHFLTVGDDKNDVLARNWDSGYGHCRIHGSQQSTPLVSLNFSAIPAFFNNLHVARNFATFCFSSTIYREQVMEIQRKVTTYAPSKETDLSATSEEVYVTVTKSLAPEVPPYKSNGLSIVLGIPALFPQSQIAVNSYVSKFPKHQKKRSSLRISRPRKPSEFNSQCSSFGSYQNSDSSESKLDQCADPVYMKMHDTCIPDVFDGRDEFVGKRSSLRNTRLRKSSDLISSGNNLDLCIDPVRMTVHDNCLDEIYDGRDESDVPSSPGSNSKQRFPIGKKSPVEKIKELRAALAEVRQNIDSARCKANILVTDTDRCWREDGAEVMLEMSDSTEWSIAVKRRGLSIYLHKPQDLRPCVVNRYTHAYMWSGDDRWKLEFCDKWDWYVFKEMHMECRERNARDIPVKTIPIPGVREVSGYEDEATPSFVRPYAYIHVVDDEVDRALTSEIARYDMDTADEEWLKLLNSRSSCIEEGKEVSSLCISDEIFEKIIFTFERDDYVSVDDPSNKERALDLCQGLGSRDMISMIYDYWLKKRKHARTALVRDFQGPPLKRMQLLHKPFLKKKRSFKRQRSQVERKQGGRGKDDDLELLKVKEAEKATNRAAEVAIKLRTRAQELMANADLAVYKSTMALRIAETIRSSSSENMESLILFD